MGQQPMTRQEENYYSVLGCSENATLSELKQNYQNLIRMHHPDKLMDSSSVSSEKFVLIDRAYKTLRNEQSRKEYDASLLQNIIDDKCLIYAEISKSELNFNSEGVAHFLCRCGDNVEIQREFFG
ncbi:hypothetical protein NQ317_003399 [Molorchus minor]|uniref:J domain-containing protein n=1 Tax=Molorchus minor TaxID=1323400 RepID=A0ABQ9K714_9CUCU|nr:hypothetical protein NQ317_003399 [Molorchus minor]